MQTCITSVNARGIQLLREIALNPRGAAGQELLPQVRRELWERLDHRGVTRLAQIPVLLFDMKFRDEQWWRDAVTAETATRRIDGSHGVPVDSIQELAREALMVAWLSARNDARVAALITGMSYSTAVLVAELTPADVSRVAVNGTKQLQLRWRRSESFWTTLLSAASDQDDHMLHLAKMHSLQLSCDVPAAEYVVAVRKSSPGKQ
jgi:hypothetical protein